MNRKQMAELARRAATTSLPAIGERNLAATEQVTVTMTKEHAMAVIHGLEMYQRVSMGHWSWVADYMGAEHGICWGPGQPECAALIEILRNSLTPSMMPNQHKGIGNASERGKLSYEVQAQMQQAIAVAEGKPNWHVWRHGALKLSGEPLPEVKFHPTPATAEGAKR